MRIRIYAMHMGFGSSGSSSFIIDLSASRHMSSVQDSFSSLHPYSGQSILMGDDSEIPTKGIDMINLDNGYLNNVLYVDDLTTNLLCIYRMKHIGSSKRVTFTQDDVEISKISTGHVVSVGIADHESRLYKFSHFLSYSSGNLLLSHAIETRKI